MRHTRGTKTVAESKPPVIRPGAAAKPPRQRRGARVRHCLAVAARAVGRGIRRVVAVAAAYALTVTGLACLVVAAAWLHPAAGWAVAGLACLVLEYDIARQGADGPPR